MSLDRTSAKIIFKLIFILYISADLIKLETVEYILKEKVAAII